MKPDIEKYLLNDTLDKIVFFLAGVIIIWLFIKATQKFILSKIRDNSSHYKAKKLSSFTGYLLIIMLLFAVYGDNMGKYSVALGFVSAGIAFALQGIIASFAGWLSIIFTGIYRTGDRIELGGIKGDVMDIGMTRTTIMEIGEWVDGDLYNGRIVFVANSFVFASPVYNYSGDFPVLWDEIKIPVRFGSNYDKAKQLFLTIGKEVAGDLSIGSKAQWDNLKNKYRLEDAQTEPMVSIVINENWVQYTLRYVVPYKKRRYVKTELFTRILKEIDETKGEIKLAIIPLESGDAAQLKN